VNVTGREKTLAFLRKGKVIGFAQKRGCAVPGRLEGVPLNFDEVQAEEWLEEIINNGMLLSYFDSKETYYPCVRPNASPEPPSVS
jgi:hypothetical protein